MPRAICLLRQCASVILACLTPGVASTRHSNRRKLPAVAGIALIFPALLYAACCHAQSAPANPQVQVAQELRDYWLGAAQVFSERAAAATSPTTRDVALEIAAKAAERAKSYDAQIKAAITAMNAPKPTAPFTIPAIPTIGPPAIPHIDLTPLAPLVMPAFGGPPVDTVFSRARQCEQDAKQYDSSGPDDPDHHLAEKLRRRQVFLQCHIPELREMADRYDKQAAEKDEAAVAEKRPNDKASLTAQADMERQVAALLRHGADALANGAPATPPSLFLPVLDQTTTKDQPGGALCKSLPKPAAEGPNDPYLLCDCAKEYLSTTVDGRYRSMLQRVLHDLSADAYLNDNGILRYAQADLAIDIARKIPLLEAVSTQACQVNLVALEQAKLLAAQPHSPATDEDQVINYSAKWVRDDIYRDIETRVADLWLDYFKEIELGMGAINPPDALSLRWYQTYRFKSDLQSLYDEWKPIFKAEEPSGTVDITGWAEEYVGVCAANNAALRQWIDMTASAMKAILWPMHEARGALTNDLKRWQSLAAADSWPDQSSLVPLGEAADQMWLTRYIGEYSKNDYGHEPKTTEETIFGPPRRDPFADPSPMSIDKAPVGYDEFFGAHDDCSTWKVTAPPDVYVTYPIYSSATVTGHVDLPGVDPNELALLQQSQRGGPVASLSFRNRGVIYLTVDLFKQKEEIADFFFSGADLGQNP